MLALSLVKDATERGVMVVIAISLCVFQLPWVGMLVGLITVFALLGPSAFVNQKVELDFAHTKREGSDKN